MTETLQWDAPAMSHAPRIADAAAVDGLLRCWVRENALVLPVGDALELPLLVAGVTIRAHVLHRSPSGHHRFGEVRLDNGAPLTAVPLASLLAMEAASGRGTQPDAVTDLVGRVADSAQRVANYVRQRSAQPEDPEGTTPFLAAEQALVLGHPLHPTPKSRSGLSDTEDQRYSPELRGSFPLHWFAADPSVVSADGPDLLTYHAPEVPCGMVPVPAHPWQAREVRSRPAIQQLMHKGLLVDLGESGEHWSPTASVRTLYNPNSPVMLKVSLGVAITNSKRENLRKELRRGHEMDRLLGSGLAIELARAHPGFGIVRDSAWLTVDVEGAEESGLEIDIRANPFGADDSVACVAGLLAERPDRYGSQLSGIITGLAAAHATDTDTIAEQWIARYFDSMIAPVLWLYRTYGLGLEAHQQNSVLVLDEQGWPCGGWYRDNQGFYISETQVAELERFFPGVGIAGDNRCDDGVINERLGYYIGINNLLGVVGAFGSQGLADEWRLLSVLRERLGAFSDLVLARTLADEPSLRCKANLLTRVDGLDELVGPLETQSVYCTIPNPIAQAGDLG